MHVDDAGSLSSILSFAEEFEEELIGLLAWMV